MKVLNLQCSHGHGFEGWFASNEAFEAQLSGGLVECPVCGGKDITKLLAAPRLNLGGGKAPAEPQAAQALQAQHQQQQQNGRWLRAVRELMATTEDVGERFADEARKIHYGEVKERGIRGQATREETAALADEGIAVMQIALPAALKETLQ
ncbi:DUF1178 family protein [Variovorax sp. LARHSF232]